MKSNYSSTHTLTFYLRSPQPNVIFKSDDLLTKCNDFQKKRSKYTEEAVCACASTGEKKNTHEMKNDPTSPLIALFGVLLHTKSTKYSQPSAHHRTAPSSDKRTHFCTKVEATQIFPISWKAMCTEKELDDVSTCTVCVCADVRFGGYGGDKNFRLDSTLNNKIR